MVPTRSSNDLKAAEFLQREREQSVKAIAGLHAEPEGLRIRVVLQKDPEYILRSHCKDMTRQKGRDTPCRKPGQGHSRDGTRSEPGQPCLSATGTET